MGRYLMFVSYVGTHYHGVQIQRGPDSVKTIQGVLENLLQQINPWYESKLYTSSRTDAGVHALSNALHFDCLHRYHPDKEYTPEKLTIRLNKYLKKSQENISVLSIQRINDDFNSRFQATGRSYLYRLAIAQQLGYSTLHPVSILDQNMILIVNQPFNTDLFLKSMELFGGTHDFSAFTTENFLLQNPHKNPIKTMSVGVTRGLSMKHVCMKSETPTFKYWDLHFHSSSFLFHQVRAMVSALIQVGRGKLHLDDLKRVLDDPAHRKFLPQSAITAVHPGGLYLKNVHYDPKDLVYTPRCDVPLVESRQDNLSDDQRTETATADIFNKNLKHSCDKVASLSSVESMHSLNSDSENTSEHLQSITEEGNS